MQAFLEGAEPPARRVLVCRLCDPTMEKLRRLRTQNAPARLKRGLRGCRWLST
jgi:hypothetical protein